jgi:hypothetical protein
MLVYEQRDQLYITALHARPRLYDVLSRTVTEWLEQHGASAEVLAQTRRVLELDAAFCPRPGAAHTFEPTFEFDAERVAFHLNRMELPEPDAFLPRTVTLSVRHPGGVGEVLKDPDGGSWFRGQVQNAPAPRASSGEHSAGHAP